jgi:hypothetical protein
MVKTYVYFSFTAELYVIAIYRILDIDNIYDISYSCQE